MESRAPGKLISIVGVSAPRPTLFGAALLVLVFFLGGVDPPVAEGDEYIVRLSYGGTQNLFEAEVLLYDLERTCNTLSVHPTDPPSGDTAWTSLTILPTPEGQFPDRGLNVPNDVLFQYAVARAKPSDGAGGGAGYFSVFGCNDQIPQPSPTGPVLIDITMQDIPIYPSISPTERDFGSVELGSSSSTIFTISNDGVLSVSDVYANLEDPSFVITDGTDWPVDLFPGNNVDVEVTFTPTFLGSHEGILLLEYTLSELPAGYQDHGEEVPLSGTGVEVVPPVWSQAFTAGVEFADRSKGLNYLLGILIAVGTIILWKRLKIRK